jgi:tRNA dimethylallyltransferase
MKKRILAITGTTATGKTTLAIKKAKELNGEIISVDSRQLYRYLDIVTGKDITNNNFELVTVLANGFRLGFYKIEKIPVWLYDVVDPKKPFSSYDWALCAKEAIKLIEKKNKLPILVGGSYFYLQSLLYGLKSAGVGPNWPLRQKLAKLEIGLLQQKLKQISADSFSKLNQSDKQNKRRLIRHLEKLTEDRSPRFQPCLGIISDYQVEIIGLKFNSRQDLAVQIEKRVEKRLAKGALEEIELLLQMGYKRDDPGMQTIGYQQLLAYINDEASLKEAKEQWIKKEVQYAKRQLTFMKKNQEISWQVCYYN